MREHVYAVFTVLTEADESALMFLQVRYVLRM